MRWVFGLKNHTEAAVEATVQTFRASIRLLRPDLDIDLIRTWEEIRGFESDNEYRVFFSKQLLGITLYHPKRIRIWQNGFTRLSDV